MIDFVLFFDFDLPPNAGKAYERKELFQPIAFLFRLKIRWLRLNVAMLYLIRS